jgi:glycerol kinase
MSAAKLVAAIDHGTTSTRCILFARDDMEQVWQQAQECVHAGSLTILGQIAAGTPFDPDSVADAYWAICNERPDVWREEYRFEGVEEPAASAS